MSHTDDNLVRLIRSIRDDLRVAFWHLLLNSFAGSILTPRALRIVIYRAAGMNIRTPKVTHGVTFTGRKVTIGRGTFVNQGVLVQAGPITIGEDSQIGFDVKLITSTHDYEPDGTLIAEAHQLPVVIGSRCWIGAGAIVLPGVTICDDVTVAAGAVVNRDLTTPGLYAGVPADFKRPLIAIEPLTVKYPMNATPYRETSP
jgi:maltose O-acetyltransferase